MSDFNLNLRIVWGNKVPKRFVPKSLDGGTGWGVFDRKEDRFLKDREVAKLPAEQALEAVWAN